jgi:hypothetical protein
MQTDVNGTLESATKHIHVREEKGNRLVNFGRKKDERKKVQVDSTQKGGGEGTSVSKVCPPCKFNVSSCSNGKNA